MFFVIFKGWYGGLEDLKCSKYDIKKPQEFNW